MLFTETVEVILQIVNLLLGASEWDVGQVNVFVYVLTINCVISPLLQLSDRKIINHNSAIVTDVLLDAIYLAFNIKFQLSTGASTSTSPFQVLTVVYPAAMICLTLRSTSNYLKIRDAMGESKPVVTELMQLARGSVRNLRGSMRNLDLSGLSNHSLSGKDGSNKGSERVSKNESSPGRLAGEKKKRGKPSENKQEEKGPLDDWSSDESEGDNQAGEGDEENEDDESFEADEGNEPNAPPKPGIPMFLARERGLVKPHLWIRVARAGFFQLFFTLISLHLR